VTALTINRLAEREIGALIDHVVGNKLLSPSVRQNVIARTDGIPLFVEEMTKAVLELGNEGASEHIAAAIPSQALTLPPSLHASLMARLDRLGPAKEVAQIGAAIGREFSQALVASVVSKPEVEVNLALDRLVAAGLLFRQGVAPHATYLFKHALVQDAAYGTLLREPRRALHARIANAFQNQFPEFTESQPELLARHYTEAGLIDKAALLWGKAGLRSLARSALIEAVEQLRRALDQIVTLPPTTALRREEVKFQVALISPLIHVKGHAASETKAAAKRARFLIEQAEARGEPPDDPMLMFFVLYNFRAANYVGFNGDAMSGFAAEFLALAEKQGATVPLMLGHRLMGVSLATMGKLIQARTHYDLALPLYNPVAHRSLAAHFTADIRVAILNFRTWTLWVLGYPNAALDDADQALIEAREVGLASTLMPALNNVLLTRIFCGDCETAIAEAEELSLLAQEKCASQWKAAGMLHQGFVLTLIGEATKAVEMLMSAVAAWQSTGARVWMPLWFSYLAKAHADLGRFDDAWRYIGEAMTIAETTKERWFQAELHRIGGELSHRSQRPDELKAQEYFERALAVARQQQAKSWELRAAMSLARLWRVQGKVQEARELLAPVYGWFTEGFDTRDLKEAKALLEELAA
jgi:predicted ATPase